MNKKYIVRLTATERRTLREIIKKLKGSSQKVRRAQMLLKADVSGPAWTDEQIAEAFESRTRTVEKLRERFVTDGFAQTVDGVPKWRRRAAEFGGAGLLKVSKVTEVVSRRRSKRWDSQVILCVFDVWRPGVGSSHPWSPGCGNGGSSGLTPLP